MTIQHIEESKKLKKAGAKLGREKLALRVLECIEYMENDQHYQGVIEFVGRMKAIFEACKNEPYWKEKAFAGYRKEYYNLQYIAEGGNPEYYGYHGIIIKKQS